MKKLLAFIVLPGLIAGGVGAWVYTGIRQPFRGYSTPDQFVDIPNGIGARAIGDRLAGAGVVRDHITFRAAMWAAGKNVKLKAGEYRFTDPMSPVEVIDKLRRGDVYVIPITFPEGLNVFEMSKIFETKGFGPAQTFVDAARPHEGYLFPDTYAVSRHTDAPKLVKIMSDAFERALTPEIRAAAMDRGFDERQLVTLASIVEKETGNPMERPLVASVYENRLRIGMPLQCDPTVIYALELAGKWGGNIRKDDLGIDSPYNTYRYPGLPPGPIASPGRASLEAVAHPADSEYLYFVSKNDGTHVFAKTMAEHGRNVQKFQVDYFKSRATASPSSTSREAPRSSSASRDGSGASARGRGRR